MGDGKRAGRTVVSRLNRLQEEAFNITARQRVRFGSLAVDPDRFRVVPRKSIQEPD